jgi:hypothetical protein
MEHKPILQLLQLPLEVEKDGLETGKMPDLSSGNLERQAHN